MGLFFYVLGAEAMEVKDPGKEQPGWQAFFCRQNDEFDKFLVEEITECKRNELLYLCRLRPISQLTPEQIERAVLLSDMKYFMNLKLRTQKKNVKNLLERVKAYPESLPEFFEMRTDEGDCFFVYLIKLYSKTREVFESEFNWDSTIVDGKSLQSYHDERWNNKRKPSNATSSEKRPKNK